MRRVLASLTIVTVAFVILPTAPAAAEPSGPSGPSARPVPCATLTDLGAVTAAVIDGNQPLAKARAHRLRKIAARDDVPRKVKSALGRLAHFFEDARNLSINERTAAVLRLRVPIALIATYSAQVCPRAATTTTSSRPG